jgi:DNA-binding transcriptional LysR family regulator
MGTPKSTVGRAIARLEEELGVSLVRRMAQGPALTEPGRVLADRAAPHIAGLRDAAIAQGSESQEVYGLLRVTAPADIGAHLIAPLLPGFFARHPRVRVEVENTLRVVDLVREGFDLAVRVTMGRLPPSSLTAKKLAPMNLALYAGTQYAARNDLPKHLDDLASHDNVVFYPGTNTLAFVGPKGPETVKVNGRAAGNDFFFLREAIASGLGIGPLPWFLASQEVGPPAASCASFLSTAPSAAPRISFTHRPSRSRPSWFDSARICSSTCRASRRFRKLRNMHGRRRRPGRAATSRGTDGHPPGGAG